MPKNAHPHMASLKDRTYFFNFPIFVDPIVDYTRFFFSFFFFPFLKLEMKTNRVYALWDLEGRLRKKMSLH